MSKKQPAGCFVFFFFFIFFIIGTLVLVLGIKNLTKAKASANWPTVQGQVITSDVVRKHDSDGSTYGADVYYEFDLNNVKYSSNKVSFGSYSSSDASHARKIVRKYPPESIVTVYYNPNNPDEAVLETGIGGGIYILLIVGLIFALVGLGGAFSFYWEKLVKFIKSWLYPPEQ